MSHNNIIELFAESFSKAIKLRLRSDVPIGISLSGGIDSSTVAAFASNQAGDLTGINYGHPGLKETEGPVVSALSEKFNIKSLFVWSSEEELRKAFWETLQAQESPVYGMSYIAEYMVYKKAHDAGIKVMLGGQGGDESFMGYRKYMFYYLQYLLRAKQFQKALQVFSWIGSNAYYQIGHLKDYALSVKRYVSAQGIQTNLLLPPSRFNLNLSSDQELWQRQVKDLTITSLPTQLKSEDRNSMRNSIETRLPFLDFNIVELGMAMPPELKINKGYSKWAIREIGKGKVPDNVRLAKYKRSFDIRQKVISDKMVSEIQQMLRDNYNKISPYLCDEKSLSLYNPSTINKNHLRFQEVMVLLWIVKNF